MRPDSKVIITGSQGMLGTDLLFHLQRSFGSQTVVGFSRTQLDISRVIDIERALHDLKPTHWINAAAYTNVDGAESERELARTINAVAPEHLARACQAGGVRLVHFSTDQVFDGRGVRPWTEEDVPNPLNFYAQTKLEGERAVLSVPRNIVLRVQWLYGAKKERFSQLREKQVFHPFSDQTGAPMWTRDIARLFPGVLEMAGGLYHLAYDDWATWADVFQFAKDRLGCSVELVPRRTAEVRLSAARPLFCALSNQKIRQALSIPSIGRWRDALGEFLGGLGAF